MEEREKVVEAIEDSIMKVEFNIEDGYLTTINLNMKSKEELGRIDTKDKIILIKWLNNVKAGLAQALANQPSEITEIEMPPSEEQPPEKKCSRCGGELIKKKGCCGSKAEVLRCKECGSNHKMVKPKFNNRNLESPTFLPNGEVTMGE